MEISEELNRLIRGKVDRNEFSGVVLIKQRDKVIFSGSYGFANRTWKIQNSLDTRFRIASISKMFTAVAILQLVEKGKLSLETKACEYLNLKTTKIPDDITIKSLLTHTSGIADYFDESQGDEEWEKLWSEIPIYKIRSLEDYLELFIHKEPVSKVNEKYHYNGAGYILLGLMIEKASGLSYFDYVKENIFTKLDMRASDFSALDVAADKTAGGYEPELDNDNKVIGWKKNIYKTTPEAASDGGATSTAEDLVKFIRGLRNKGLLGEKMSSEILTPKVFERSDVYKGYKWMYGYGCEFILSKADNSIIRFGHTGEEAGVSCRLYYYPGSELDVVILANQGRCAGDLGWGIHDIIISNWEVFI